MTAAAEGSAVLLPPAAAEEVLRRYADLLRVGRIRVNGVVVRWDTDTSTELQLKGFCTSLGARLADLLPGLAEGTLRLAAYWVCKAVSINYALIEVLLLVRRRVGVFCTIETRAEWGDGLVEYAVEVLPEGPSLRVSLTWSRGDNIVFRDPRTAVHRVKGTLRRLEGEFGLPPAPGFAPTYRLQMLLRKSLAARLAARLACGGADRRPPGGAEAVLVEEPLCYYDRDHLTELGLGSDGGPLPWRVCSVEEPFDSAVLAAHQEPGLLPLGGGGAGPEAIGAAAAVVGRLCVHRLRLLGGPCGAAAEGDGKGTQPGPELLYATCAAAGQTRRTRAVPSCPSPAWLEAWSFPMRGRDLRGEVLVEVFGTRPGQRELQLLGRASVLVSLALGRGGKVAIAEPLRGTAARGLVELELEFLPGAASAAEGGRRACTEEGGKGEACLGVAAPAAVGAGRARSPAAPPDAPYPRLRVQACAVPHPKPGACELWPCASLECG